MQGWAKVKSAASYAGISERTFREWLNNGLNFVRLPTGTILIKYTAIDEYLFRFEATQQQNAVDEIVEETMREFK